MKYLKLIKIAKDIINDKISPIEGIRDLVALAYEYNLEKEDIFMSLRGIESQTDHLIIDNNKIKLSKTYRKKIKEEEKLYLDDIYKLCSNILEKYYIDEAPKLNK